MKLVVREPASEDAIAISAGSYRPLVARIAYPEARAALAAARRARRLTPLGLRKATLALDDRWRRLAVVELNAGIARVAGDLAEEHSLRGYDAVQLATGLAAGAGATFVTWDRELARAARASGLATIPV